MKKPVLALTLCALISTGSVFAAQPPRDNFYWLGQINKASDVINTDEGLLTPEEGHAFAKGIDKVLRDGNLPGAARPHNVITFEPYLIKAAGPDVTKIHAGRSSQDMLTTVGIMEQREHLLTMAKKLNQVQGDFIRLAEENKDTLIPNYTNGVAAQPNSLAHYFIAYANAYGRDMQRVREYYKRLNRSPMGSTVLILYFGSKNVLNSGWTVWNIAAFTTFLSCYGKLAVKSSKAAKLFNSVQKANVSWKRIRPLLTEPPEETEEKTAGAVSLKLDQAGGAYPGGKQIFDGLTISAKPGQIIGITGPVACGKSTLGKIFLGEVPYTGHVLLNGKELSEYSDKERRSMVGWQGHDPELLADSVRNNVALGEEQIDVGRELSRVCLDREVSEMENGIDTLVGSRGVRLSGGQQARTALARTLSHAKPLIVLDDPFAALDRNTEEEIFRELKAMSKDRIILLISHRLYLFDQTDQVIWMENGQTQTGTHEKMLQIVPEYANLCKVWKEGADHA